MRPVLVMSNNKINNSEKVVVVCITDAKEKANANNFVCVAYNEDVKEKI